MSHAGNLGLYAFGRGLPLGIDAERITLGFGWKEVASTAFSGPELHAIMGLPEDQKLKGFFAIWTRKEALAKAVGLGLRAELASLEVPTDPGFAGWSRRCVETPGGRVDCSLVDLSPGHGCRGALALVGRSADVSNFESAAGDTLPTVEILMPGLFDIPARLGEQRTPFAGGIAVLSGRAA